MWSILVVCSLLVLLSIQSVAISLPHKHLWLSHETEREMMDERKAEEKHMNDQIHHMFVSNICRVYIEFLLYQKIAYSFKNQII